MSNEASSERRVSSVNVLALPEVVINPNTHNGNLVHPNHRSMLSVFVKKSGDLPNIILEEKMNLFREDIIRRANIIAFSLNTYFYTNEMFGLFATAFEGKNQSVGIETLTEKLESENIPGFRKGFQRHDGVLTNILMDLNTVLQKVVKPYSLENKPVQIGYGFWTNPLKNGSTNDYDRGIKFNMGLDSHEIPEYERIIDITKAPMGGELIPPHVCQAFKEHENTLLQEEREIYVDGTEVYVKENYGSYARKSNDRDNIRLFTGSDKIKGIVASLKGLINSNIKPSKIEDALSEGMDEQYEFGHRESTYVKGQRRLVVSIHYLNKIRSTPVFLLNYSVPFLEINFEGEDPLFNR